MSRLMLTLCISLVIIACRANPRSDDLETCPEPNNNSWSASQVADYETVLEHLENYVEDVNNVRAPEYQPAQVLPRLHPWFKDGLCEGKLEGQTIHFLQNIPDRLITDIQLSSTHHGPVAFGILNASFWREIQAAQKAGLTVGFLEFSKGFEVAGVYHSHGKIIGVDLFANRGTIQHEMRHHKQHQASPTWPYYTLLKRSCIIQTGRFLGELDSTTVQLGSWQQTFDGVQIEALLSQPKPIRRNYSQTNFLYANLNYPQLAAGWMIDQDCPAELMTAVQEIYGKTNAALTNITGLARRLVGLHSNLVVVLEQIAQRCPTDDTTEPTCVMMRERRDRQIAEGKSLKIKLNQELGQEAIARPIYIKEILDRMPRRIKKDLANYSGAYRLLMGL